jgi:hypothetical protein
LALFVLRNILRLFLVTNHTKPLPPVPYDACDKQSVRVSSLSLVRYHSNDYSVPTAYGHQEVLVRGYVHEVVIAYGAVIRAPGRRRITSLTRFTIWR